MVKSQITIVKKTLWWWRHTMIRERSHSTVAMQKSGKRHFVVPPTPTDTARPKRTPNACPHWVDNQCTFAWCQCWCSFQVLLVVAAQNTWDRRKKSNQTFLVQRSFPSLASGGWLRSFPTFVRCLLRAAACAKVNENSPLIEMLMGFVPLP